MADHSVEAREFDKAVLLYREALSHKDTDQKVRLDTLTLFPHPQESLIRRCSLSRNYFYPWTT